jgi:putative membrane protein
MPPVRERTRGRKGTLMNWRNILITWAATAVAVWVAILVLQPFGLVTVNGTGLAAAVVVGGVLGLLNAFVKPVLKFLSCGCIVLTLGLFVFVLNALVLWMAGAIAGWFGLTFEMGFWGAFWGALIVSIVTFFLGIFLPDPDAAT